MKRFPLSVLFALVLSCIPPPAFAAPMPAGHSFAAATPCEALSHEDFTKLKGAPASIISAKTVAAGPNAPEYCQVSGIVAPQVGFELRLPTAGWNGRYFQAGCGGFCGIVDTESCGDALAANFATGAENMGHAGGMWSPPLWGEDPLLRRDFGNRSTHVTAIAAKAIIAKYYGRPPDFAYFRGCSTGGREGLAEAQYYPEDFNGIIAGDPAFPMRLGAFLDNWDARQLLDRKTGAPVFSPEKLALLHQTALKSCDAADGLEDGIIDDPRACHIDLAQLRCPSGQDRPDCLTDKQEGAAQRLYDGPRDSRGRALYPGHLMYGSEVDWNGFLNKAIADNFLRYLAFNGPVKPNFDNWDVDFDRDPPRLEANASLYDPVPPRGKPDLSVFAARGGKLILYHGWADATVPPLGSLDYYAKVTAQAGGLAKVKTWFRVFMVPGMLHCRGGDAPNQFDMLSPMVEWVEQNQAPELIVAVQQKDGKTFRSRPLVPYPKVAHYSGSGDVNAAANWAARDPAKIYDDDVAWIWAPDAGKSPSP